MSSSTSSSNVLRMTGMNSGLDTESIVKAMTAATKLKITKSERKVLKYQAQQTAYRDIISKLSNLQSKYFDTLNSKTNLKSASLFNQFKASVSTTLPDGSNSSTAPKGITVTSGTNALSGNYDVTINSTATQATLKGATYGSENAFDLSQFEGNTSSTYSMNVTVGGTTKQITFDGGTQQEMLDSINNGLLQFGKTNAGTGLVQMDSNGKITSIDKKAISSSNATELTTGTELKTSGLATGSNSFTVSINGEQKTVSFKTIADSYFDDVVDSDGNVLSGADSTKKTLYETVKKDLYNNKVADAYDAWKNDADYTTKADALLTTSYDEWNSTANDVTKTNLHNIAYAAEKKKQYSEAYTAAYNTSKANAYAAANPVDEGGNAIAIDDWTYSKADFEASVEYASFDANYTELTQEQFDAANSMKDIYEDYVYNEETAYGKSVYTPSYDDFSVSNQDVVDHYNQTNFSNSLENITFKDGTKLSLSYSTRQESVTEEDGVSSLVDVTYAAVSASRDNNGTPEAVEFSITAAESNASDTGATVNKVTENTLTSSSKLSALGLTADANGKYNVTLNGTELTFEGDATIKEMMKAINASDAGVELSFSSLTNSFTLSSTDYGAQSAISVDDDPQGLFEKLGLGSGATLTAGTNMTLDINGQSIETSSNSFTIDGTTITANSTTAAGTTFSIGVERDYTDAIAAVKSFVEDYNAAVKDIYAYVDEKPNKDYYFLTDDDKEDMDLSDKQEEKWETMAKKGLLYNDSTVSSVMSSLRTTLYEGITNADGSTFALYSMGITTSSDWTAHGKLVLDETKLKNAFETNADEISKLFTDSTNGIMTKFNKALDGAVKSTGARTEKGTLVQKAGLESGTSATDNYLYDMIKSTNTLITSLKDRYEQQQNRYWKIYSNLETSMSSLNSQTNYISQLMSM